MKEEQQSDPLRLLEDILYNRIKQKKQEMHRTHNRANTDHVWTEIETLQWILAQSLYQKAAADTILLLIIIIMITSRRKSVSLSFFWLHQIFFDTKVIVIEVYISKIPFLS